MIHAIPYDTDIGPSCGLEGCETNAALRILIDESVIGIDLCWFHAVGLSDSIASALGVDKCEHGIVDGEWCGPCNLAYKQAMIDNDDYPIDHGTWTGDIKENQ